VLSGIPIIAGVASAFFVVCANPWMNTPTGSPSTADTGFGVASVYAVAIPPGKDDRYHRIGLLVPLTAAVILTPIQISVGTGRRG
jgi:cytochrome d ubiquinol oxidase subunit I